MGLCILPTISTGFGASFRRVGGDNCSGVSFRLSCREFVTMAAVLFMTGEVRQRSRSLIESNGSLSSSVVISLTLAVVLCMISLGCSMV